jgi:hypothetical protein
MRSKVLPGTHLAITGAIHTVELSGGHFGLSTSKVLCAELGKGHLREGWHVHRRELEHHVLKFIEEHKSLTNRTQ